MTDNKVRDDIGDAISELTGMAKRDLELERDRMATHSPGLVHAPATPTQSACRFLVHMTKTTETLNTTLRETLRLVEEVKKQS